MHVSSSVSVRIIRIKFRILCWTWCVQLSKKEIQCLKNSWTLYWLISLIHKRWIWNNLKSMLNCSKPYVAKFSNEYSISGSRGHWFPFCSMKLKLCGIWFMTEWVTLCCSPWVVRQVQKSSTMPWSAVIIARRLYFSQSQPDAKVQVHGLFRWLIQSCQHMQWFRKPQVHQYFMLSCLNRVFFYNLYFVYAKSLSLSVG